jgi:hypothetical protein
MPPEKEVRHGDGAFQWNRAGWFGSQLGATLWPLLLGVAVLTHSKALGAELVVLALLPNAIGIHLWLRRHEIAPYPAIQILVAACGLSALLSLFVVARAGMSPSSLGLPPGILPIYPALMLVFHLRERAARQAVR